MWENAYIYSIENLKASRAYLRPTDAAPLPPPDKILDPHLNIVIILLVSTINKCLVSTFSHLFSRETIAQNKVLKSIDNVGYGVEK